MSPPRAAPPVDLGRLERAERLEPRSLGIASVLDRFAAGALALDAATAMGFGRRARAAAQIVACELAENLALHAGGGALEVSRCPGLGMVRIVASDHGPPFRSIAPAFADGSTEAGALLPEEIYGRTGIGSGLGAVLRLAEAVLVEQGEAGKRIVAFLGSSEGARLAPCPLLVRGVGPAGGVS